MEEQFTIKEVVEYLMSYFDQEKLPEKGTAYYKLYNAMVFILTTSSERKHIEIEEAFRIRD